MTSDLVPVFVPPLANLLANAEREKGSPLTQKEVVAIRDSGVCTMMKKKDAEALRVGRGFRDVEPEDCWADWHRLRPQLAGGYLPKIVLGVLGDEGFAEKARTLLERKGVECEIQARDERMPDAFDASAFASNSFGKDDRAAVARHQHVVYVVGKNSAPADAMDSARSALATLAELFEAGGTAAKCESSGIAHGRARWVELARDSRDRDVDGAAALYTAFVQPLIRSGRDIHSCGMHLVGKPDLVAPSGEGAATLARLFHIFAVYLLAECPEGAFRSGQTFALAHDEPRYVVTWEPCTGYDEDDLFHNSFGRYRFTLA